MEKEIQNDNKKEESQKKLFQILKELQSQINKESSIHELCIIYLNYLYYSRANKRRIKIKYQ